MSKQNELAQLADAVTVDGSNVGIGTSSPASLVTVSSGVNTETRTLLVDNAHSGGSMYNAFGVYVGETDRKVTLSADYGQSLMGFKTNGHERLRIEDNGDVKIGNGISTSVIGIVNANNDNTKQGVSFRETGYIAASRINDTVMYLNRMTSSASNGQIVSFRTNGTEHGSIGRGGSGFFIAGIASSNFGVVFDGSGLISSTGSGVIRDNQYNIGHGAYRWTNIYATNGSINTSDQTEKQDIAPLTATEMLVAKRISAMFKNYRWKDKVTTEGDSARNHTGIIAQDVQAAFTAESLDASNYGLFCSDTWWETQTEVPAVESVAEVTDEDGNVTTEAVEAKDAYTRTDNYDTEAEAPEGATSKTRLGIRYPELLSFVAAYNEQRFSSIEARLTALEA